MATDWEQLYQDDIKPWDKGAPAPPLLDWFEQNPNLMSGDILVPGCGTGHDVRAIASHVADARKIVGLDISSTALDQAQAFPKTGRETYLLDDLFSLHETSPIRYHWIWEHTCFCAIEIERRDEYVEAVHRLLRPDGVLLGVFFLDPYDDEHRPGEGPPHGCTEAELLKRFVDSGFFSITENYRPAHTFPGREDRELVLRLSPVH